MPDEFGEHLTREQRPFLHTEYLQIPRSMLALLLFSSSHSFSIGSRIGCTGMADAWFCAQWPIFVLILMFVFGSMSWKIQTWPVIRFVAQAVRFRLFICWYLIESMMPCVRTRYPGPLPEVG